jgi:hypothetical protein
MSASQIAFAATIRSDRLAVSFAMCNYQSFHLFRFKEKFLQGVAPFVAALMLKTLPNRLDH